MKRRVFVTGFAGLLAAPRAAEAQPAGKVPRIGFLSDSRQPWDEGFRQGLRELGYVAGHNITIEYRYGEGKFERLPGLAAELVRLNVDLVVAGGTQATSSAKQATGVIPIVVRSSNEFDKAFSVINNARADVLYTLGDSLFANNRKRIVDFAAKNQLASMFSTRQAVEAGGLVSYGTDFVDLFRRAAIYVDKILKGAKPADLPIEQRTKFELVINLKTAKALGLTILPSLLLRADQVIE